MPNIRPIKDLRNTNEISEICHKSEEPIFITKNGYGDLVIMSMETYEKKMAQLEIVEKLMVAESELKYPENLIDGREALKKLRKKHVKR